MRLIRWFFSLFRQPPTLATPVIEPPQPAKKSRRNRKRGRGSNYARLNPDAPILQQVKDLDRR